MAPVVAEEIAEYGEIAENGEIAEYGEVADANTELILTSPGYDGTTKYDTELDQVHLSNILSFFGSTNIPIISGENIRGRSWKTLLAAIYRYGHRGGKAIRRVFL